MIRYFCDKCEKEICDITVIVETQDVKDTKGVTIVSLQKKSHHLCKDCNEKFKRLHLDIADFMKMSDKELDFLDCTFSVGDEVITSTGKVGEIVDICTCEQCQERCFYEPSVKVKIGNGDIWITDNDKRVNFRSFYKIGNRVFGNLDEDDVLYDIKDNTEQIYSLQEVRAQLYKQLEVIHKLQKTDKHEKEE